MRASKRGLNASVWFYQQSFNGRKEPEPMNTFHRGDIVRVTPLDTDDPEANICKGGLFVVIRNRELMAGQTHVLCHFPQDDKKFKIFRAQDLEKITHSKESILKGETHA